MADDRGAEFDRQVAVLVSAGYPALAGCPARRFAAALAPLRAAAPDEPFVLVPAGLVGPSAAMGAAALGGRAGFVAADLADLEAFAPIGALEIPDGPAYLITGVERGEEYLNQTPDEALPAILDRGRTPLTVDEGIAVLTQRPDLLERNRCFMLLGSRCADRRVPALWISGGTGRDGRERRGSPKLGWCWAGNRHTWLGHASAAGRISVPALT